MLRAVQQEQRPATAQEQTVLARWSGFGAIPGVFDEDRAEYATAREQLAALTSPEEYAALRRTTLNAHYTHAGYVQAIWDTLASLGFDGGRVLEPGCGAGTFIGLAPDGAEMTGVELDPVTAAIAAALYPDAHILAQSFADTRLPAGSFDAVVGNVPFGDVKLADPVWNPGRRLSMHDHFILASVGRTRPGGMVALLTSRYTMDSRNPQARRQIAEMADLVAAIRLPSGAHRRAAGTDVVTDLLIYRRREPGRPPAAGASWEKSVPATVLGGEVRVNEYFTAGPGVVLGEMRAGRGQYGPGELEVTGPADATQSLAAALRAAVTRAQAEGLVMAGPRAAAQPAPALRPAAAGTALIPGMILNQPDYTFTRVMAVTDQGVIEEPYRPPRTQAPELRHLIRIRDTAMALLRAEQASLDDTAEISGLRARLGSVYDSYKALYGPVKRFKWGKPRKPPKRKGADEAAGSTPDGETAAAEETRPPRNRPPQGGFRSDPLYPVVYALEESYDTVTRRATKADIFTQRVIVPDPPLLGADTAAEALAICLNTCAEVRLDEIARLLGLTTTEQARDELGTLVYDDPATGQPVWAPLYVSGNVREKLAEAEAAADADPRYAPNVAALREVVPRDLGPAEIEAQLGAGWISPPYIQQFLRELLGDDQVTAEYTKAGNWEVSGGNRTSVAATSTWGTGRLCAQDLAQRLLAGTAEHIQIKDTVDRKEVPNPQATEAARQAARNIAARFAQWVWEEPGRSAVLARTYNHMWNARIPVNFDGVELFLPGLSKTLTLRKHQPAAIARVIYQGSAGLIHDTGAGKTLEAIIGVHERRRLGLSHKPCFVVQKHKLADFRDEYLRAYPGARLLVADTDDLVGDKRREFVARCATGNPDAIIISREAFTKIPVSAARQAAWLRKQKQELEDVLLDAKANGSKRTVKDIEKKILKTEEMLKARLDKIGKDSGTTYEDTGITDLVIDEAQDYRRGPIVSSIPGLGQDGSDRAIDLLLKLGHHEELHGETRVTLLTATPWTNRISEIFNWERFLRGDIGPFDPWCRTFGKITLAYEMTPTGEFKARARLREILNAPDLYLRLRELSDFKLHDTGDLDLKLPRMTGGRPRIAVADATTQHGLLARELARRLREVPKGPPQKGQDNHLSIQNDAIRAALDLRMIGWDTDEPQKADVVVDLLWDLWLEHRDDVYLQADGTEHPVKGSLVMVFASLGTPGGKGWNFYDEVRGKLLARGMPQGLVRYIHEARTMDEKDELFHKARNGEVFALLGSTAKLGMGTNVQDRAVGLIQVTSPWNWDEPHQEIGRVRREGNLNDEFFCIRVVTSPSCDALKWERARQKEQAFRQLMTGRIEGRTIRIPDDDLSTAEIMAAASGDPRLLELAEMQGNLARLELVRSDWGRNQTILAYRARDARTEITRLDKTLQMITDALPRRRNTRGKAFAMTIDGTRHAKRPDAAAALTRLITSHIGALDGRDPVRWNIGEIGGFGLTLEIRPDAYFGYPIRLHLGGIPDHDDPVGIYPLDFREGSKGKALTGLVTRLENRIAGLEQAQAEDKTRIGRLRAEADAAEAETGGTFPQQDELDQIRARVSVLEKELFSTPDSTAAASADSQDDASAGVSAGAGKGAPSPSGPGQPREQAPPSRSGPRSGPAQPDQAGGPAASRPGRSARTDPRGEARTHALTVMGGQGNGTVPDAEEFAEFFAATYGRKDSGDWPLVMQVYADEWLPRQPDDHPLKQRAAQAPAQGGPGGDDPDILFAGHWTATHPCAADISQMRQAALDDPGVSNAAQQGDWQNYEVTFRKWAARYATQLLRTALAAPGPPSAMALALTDDTSFTADLTATLNHQVHLISSGERRPDSAITAIAGRVSRTAVNDAAAAWRTRIQDARTAQCGCQGGCARCALPAAAGDRLALAAEIDIHLARAGVSHRRRSITWQPGPGETPADDPAAHTFSLTVRGPGEDQPAWQLAIPPGGELYQAGRDGRWLPAGAPAGVLRRGTTPPDVVAREFLRMAVPASPAAAASPDKQAQATGPGPVTDLHAAAAAHGLVTEIPGDGELVIRSADAARNNLAVRQEHGSGRLLSQTGRVIAPDRLDAYLAEYAALPGGDPDGLYDRMLARTGDLVAGAREHAWPKGRAHMTMSDAATRASSLGVTCYLYPDGGAYVSAEIPPAGPAYYAVSPDGEWSRRIDGTTVTVAGRPTPAQLSLVSGEQAEAPAPAIPDAPSGWTATHPYVADIGALCAAALGDADLRQKALVNREDNFGLAFAEWAGDYVAGLVPETGTGQPLPPFVEAFFDDHSFAPDLTATLRRHLYRAMREDAAELVPEADGVPEARTVREAAARWRRAIQQIRTGSCADGCTGGCRACALPPEPDAALQAAAEIDVHLARAGLHHTTRGVTWHPATGTYAVRITAGEDRWTLAVPPGDTPYHIVRSGGPHHAAFPCDRSTGPADVARAFRYLAAAGAGGAPAGEDTAGDPQPGASAVQPRPGQAGSPPPAAGAAEAADVPSTGTGNIPRVTVLHGHTSPETAYQVDDYPYSFRLRCKIRYWLETGTKGTGRGQVRLMSQTTNPKRPGEVWNTAKASTYCTWGVLYLDVKGHVQWHNASRYSGLSGAHDALMRLDGTYEQLTGPDRGTYGRLVSLGQQAGRWDGWNKALAFITAHLIEHGQPPSAEQVRAAPGFHLDSADYDVAVAAARHLPTADTPATPDTGTSSAAHTGAPAGPALQGDGAAGRPATPESETISPETPPGESAADPAPPPPPEIPAADPESSQPPGAAAAGPAAEAYHSGPELAAGQLATARAWQALQHAAETTPPRGDAGRIAGQHYEDTETLLRRAEIADSLQAAVRGYTATAEAADRIAGATTDPGCADYYYPLRGAAAQLAGAARRHARRMTAAGSAAWGLFTDPAAHDVRIHAHTDPLSLLPAPYPSGTEAGEARTTIFDLARAGQAATDGSDLPESVTRVYTRLGTLHMLPDRDHLDARIGSWQEVPAAAFAALADLTHDSPAAAPLAGIARATTAHWLRLDSYRIRAEATAGPYDSADSYTAGAATLRQAQAAWQQSPTGRRLATVTDRDARGSDLWDQRDAHRRLQEQHYQLGAHDPGADLAQASARATGAAHAAYALLLNHRPADFQDPADQILLQALTEAAYLHAARINAARDAGTAPVIAATLPADTPAPAQETGADPAQPHAPQPEPATAPAGLVIQHSHTDTVVRGSDKTDTQLHGFLHDAGFQFSRPKQIWYLPRPWKFSTRERRVNQLINALERAGRQFTPTEEPETGTTPGAAPAPIEPGEPYTKIAQARQDYLHAKRAWSALTRTPAGSSMFYTTRPRPDAAALVGTGRAVTDTGSLTGAAAELAPGLTAWAQAAQVLLDNLTAQRHRAPKFREQLEALAQRTRTLAARMTATAAQGGFPGDTTQPAPPAAARPEPQPDTPPEDPPDSYPDSQPAPAPDEPAPQAARSAQPTAEPEQAITGGPASQPEGTGNAPTAAAPEPSQTRPDDTGGPLTPAEIKRGIRQWLSRGVGGGLPGLVAAIGSNQAMRAWIGHQAANVDGYGCFYETDDPSLPPRGRRENRADSSPAGLVILRGHPGRRQETIGWEEIPAWCHTLTAEQRAGLAETAAAVAGTRRQQPGGLPAEGEEQAHELRARLTELTGRAWEAFMAAPPPDAAQLDQARTAYRDPGPPQGALFTVEPDAAPAPDTEGPAPALAAESGPDSPAAPPGAAPRPEPAAPAPAAGSGLPEGTQPLATHTPWGGSRRPERLLYGDGTQLTVRGQGEEGDQAWPATAAGMIPAGAGSDYGNGQLQVVRWDDGSCAVVHPALTCARDVDPYAGLSDRDRARWETFDAAEAFPTPVAGLPARLVDPGDVLQVDRGPRSRRFDIRKVQSIAPGTGPYADGFEVTVEGVRSPLYYPQTHRPGVFIPGEHPSLAQAIEAATATRGEDAAQADSPGAAVTGPAPAPPGGPPAVSAPEGEAPGTATPPGGLPDPRQQPLPDPAPDPAAASPQPAPSRGQQGAAGTSSRATGQDDISQPAGPGTGPLVPAPASGEPSTQLTGPVPDPSPAGDPMRFMNSMDIERAAARWQDHPVLGPASRTLASLEAWADANSDGWAHWPKPAQAADRLMSLIERDGSPRYYFDIERADATPAELLAAYTPIRAFRTRQRADFTIEVPGESAPSDGLFPAPAESGPRQDQPRPPKTATSQPAQPGPGRAGGPQPGHTSDPAAETATPVPAAPAATAPAGTAPAGTAPAGTSEQDPGPGTPQQADSGPPSENRTSVVTPGAPATAPEAGQAGPLSQRIRIDTSTARPAISGTDYAQDPPGLRAALRRHHFEWRRARQQWDYTGDPAAASEAVTAIRRTLAELDSNTATPPPDTAAGEIVAAALQGRSLAFTPPAGTDSAAVLAQIARELGQRSPSTRILYLAAAAPDQFPDRVTCTPLHSIAGQALSGTSYAAKVRNLGAGARTAQQWARILAIPAQTPTSAGTADADTMAQLAMHAISEFRDSSDAAPGAQHLPPSAAQYPDLVQLAVTYAQAAWDNITAPRNARLLTGDDPGALVVTRGDLVKIWGLTQPQLDADVILADAAQHTTEAARRILAAQHGQVIVAGESGPWLTANVAARRQDPGQRVPAWDALPAGLPAHDPDQEEPGPARAAGPEPAAAAAAEVTAGPGLGPDRLPAAPGPQAGDILEGVQATTVTRQIIALAQRGRLRPHLDGDGPRKGAHRVIVNGEGTDAIFGAIYIGSSTGKILRTVLTHGNNGTETTYTKVADVRAVLTAWLGQHELTPADVLGQGPGTDPEIRFTIPPATQGELRRWLRRKDELHAAASYLAGRSDGYAPAADGPGFTAADTYLGHYLAGIPVSRWGFMEACVAWDMLRDYSGQLAQAGITFADLPRPPGAHEMEPRERAAARDLVQRGVRIIHHDLYQPGLGFVRCDGPGADVILGVPDGHQALADEASSLPGAARNSDVHAVVLPHPSLPAAVTLAARHGVTITPEVRALAAVTAGLPGAPPHPAGEPAAAAGPPSAAATAQVASPAAVGGSPAAADTAAASAPDDAAAAQASPGPAPGPAAETGRRPVDGSDLAIALRRMGPGEFARFVLDGQTPVMSGWHSNRDDGEPDAGARDDLTFDGAGIHILVSTPGQVREGQVTWPQASAWLAPGLTPPRQELLAAAASAHTRYHVLAEVHSVRGTPEHRMLTTAAAELASIVSTTRAGIVSEALARNGPGPLPRQAPARTAAPGGGADDLLPLPGLDEPGDETITAARARITQMTSVLPGWPPQMHKPLSQIRAGDILRHPGYPDPFTVTAAPARRDDEDTTEIPGTVNGQPVTWVFYHHDAPDPQAETLAAAGLLTGPIPDAASPAPARAEPSPAAAGAGEQERQATHPQPPGEVPADVLAREAAQVRSWNEAAFVRAGLVPGGEPDLAADAGEDTDAAGLQPAGQDNVPAGAPVPETPPAPQAEEGSSTVSDTTGPETARDDPLMSPRQDGGPPPAGRSADSTASFWLNLAQNGDGEIVAEINGARHRFWLDPSQPAISQDPEQTLGFHGHRWTIRFTDGREIVTNNLMGNGRIPEQFHHLFPVNAALTDAPPAPPRPAAQTGKSSTARSSPAATTGPRATPLDDPPAAPDAAAPTGPPAPPMGPHWSPFGSDRGADDPFLRNPRPITDYVWSADPPEEDDSAPGQADSADSGIAAPAVPRGGAADVSPAQARQATAPRGDGPAGTEGQTTMTEQRDLPPRRQEPPSPGPAADGPPRGQTWTRRARSERSARLLRAVSFPPTPDAAADPRLDAVIDTAISRYEAQQPLRLPPRDAEESLVYAWLQQADAAPPGDMTRWWEQVAGQLARLRATARPGGQAAAAHTRDAAASPAAAAALPRRLDRNGSGQRADLTPAERLADVEFQVGELRRELTRWRLDAAVRRTESAPPLDGLRQTPAGGVDSVQGPGRRPESAPPLGALWQTAVDGADSVQEARTTMARALPALRGNPAWQRTGELIGQARALASDALHGLLRFADPERARRAWDAVWARTCEITGDLAAGLMRQLRPGSRTWTAARSLRHAAAEGVAHARGWLPRAERLPLGTYEAPPGRRGATGVSADAGTYLHASGAGPLNALLDFPGPLEGVPARRVPGQRARRRAGTDAHAATPPAAASRR